MGETVLTSDISADNEMLPYQHEEVANSSRIISCL